MVELSWAGRQTLRDDVKDIESYAERVPLDLDKVLLAMDALDHKDKRIQKLEAHNERLEQVFAAALEAVSNGLDMGSRYDIYPESAQKLEQAVLAMLDRER